VTRSKRWNLAGYAASLTLLASALLAQADSSPKTAFTLVASLVDAMGSPLPGATVKVLLPGTGPVVRETKAGIATTSNPTSNSVCSPISPNGRNFVSSSDSVTCS
jgi:hypothetical protein